MRSLAAIIFWRSGIKNKSTLIESPIFPVLPNHAVFFNVLWTLWMSQPKHPAVRWFALFVPRDVYSFTLVKWKRTRLSLSNSFKKKPFGKVLQRKQNNTFKYHLDKWQVRSDCWQSSCRQMLHVSITLAMEANGIVWHSFWLLAGINLEQKIDSKTLRNDVCFNKLKWAVAGSPVVMQWEKIFVVCKCVWLTIKVSSIWARIAWGGVKQPNESFCYNKQYCGSYTPS